jgi:hypothetical protein
MVAREMEIEAVKILTLPLRQSNTKRLKDKVVYISHGQCKDKLVGNNRIDRQLAIEDEFVVGLSLSLMTSSMHFFKADPGNFSAG